MRSYLQIANIAGHGPLRWPFTCLHILILLLLMLFTGIVACSHKKADTDMHGKWKGTFQGQSLLFMFNEDSSCELRFEDNATGDVNILVGKFIVVSDKTPIALTIHSIQRLNHNLHTIVQFLGDGSLKVAPFVPIRKFRPISFNNAAYLKRL
jgi:hypothetical protein